MKEERKVSTKFAANLAYYRQLRGYSLAELSEITKISGSYLNRMERGERLAPSIPVASKIAEALKIPLSTLLDISTTFSSAEEAKTISQLLIENDFKIEESKIISEQSKQILIDIIEKIIYIEWTNESKVTDLFKLSELIEDFKEEMKA